MDVFSLLLISGVSNKEIHIHGNFRLEKKFKTLFTIYKRERGERIKLNKITNRHTNIIEIIFFFVKRAARISLNIEKFR